MEKFAFAPKWWALSTKTLGLVIGIFGLFISSGSVKKYFAYLPFFIFYILLIGLI